MRPCGLDRQRRALPPPLREELLRLPASRIEGVRDEAVVDLGDRRPDRLAGTGLAQHADQHADGERVRIHRRPFVTVTFEVPGHRLESDEPQRPHRRAQVERLDLGDGRDLEPLSLEVVLPGA